MRVHIGNIDLYYEKRTTESSGKQPVILLHGNGEDHTIFDLLANKLSEKFTVYSLDSRCHGQSDSPVEISYGLMADDLLKFVEVLHLKGAIVLGFSDGAIVGLLAELKFPSIFSKLILCGVNTAPQQLKLRVRIGMWFMHRLTNDPKILMMLKEPNISEEDLNKLSLPVLIVAGTEDIISAHHTKKIAKAIPNAQLNILKGETHSSYIKHEERLLRVISAFLYVN